VSSRDDCETIGRQVYDRIVPGRNTVPSEGTMLAELRNEQRLILLSNLDYPGAEIGRLLELAPSCSWVFTSRKPKSSIPDVHPVPLSGLPESEALQVFEDRLDAQRLQLYDQDDIRLICRELRYLPGPIITKALSDNLSQIAPEATRKALARSLLDQVTDGFRSDDAKARRSLIDSARPVAGMLDKNECILAAYLAQFGSTKALEIVPHEFVQYALAASNLPPSVLMSLLKRGTLTEHSPRYSLDPALAMLAREEWVDKTIKDTVAEYFCDLAVKVQFRDDYLERYETRFLDARDWLYKRRMWKKVILIVQALDRWLLVTGQWTQWEIGLKQAINAAKRIHRHSRRKADYQTATWATKVEAWALLQLGGKEYALRNPDSARNLWKTALELRQKSGEHEGVRLVRENLNALPSARKHGFRSPVTLVAGYILAFVVLTVVVLAFGGAIGLVAYVLTLSTAVLGVYWIIGLLKKKRMLYSIPGDHVAVIERDGTTPREVIGPLNQNWRNPLTELHIAQSPDHH
jgi:hypothetical protein